MRRIAVVPVLSMILLVSLNGAPARAIVGGAADSGPLSRQSVMVLAAGGRVCSAIVLAPDTVLTAAHCVTGASGYRVHYRSAAGQPVLIEPRAIAVHPGYDANAVQNRTRSIDLAIVKLPAPLPHPFEPVQLNARSDPPRAGTALTLGGWGVVAAGDARSTGTFRSVSLAVVEPYGPSRILIWAKGNGVAGACQGDSGGPIVDTGGTVLAVATWATGSGAGACGAITQGVLVGPQAKWIADTLTRLAARR